MKITKTWYYKSSELKEKNIFIWDNINVFIFDDFSLLENIEVWSNSFLEYYSDFSKDWDYKKNIIINWEKSKVKVRSLIYSENNKVKVKVFWNIKSSLSKLDMKILSFAWENWNINLDWILKIDWKIKEVEWYLNEENIFLWNKWKISWIPTLLVETNDVKASHSCTMEKIGTEQLFYLRSRGIPRDESLQMTIEAKIRSLFKCFEMIDKEKYYNLIKL